MEWTHKTVRELKESMDEAWVAFAENYIIHFNGTRAALAAGYAESGAHVQATRMLNNDKVQLYLQYLISDRSKRLQVTADKVVQEIAKIAFHNVEELLDYFEGHVLFKDLDQMKFPEIIREIEVREQMNKKGERIGKIAKIRIYDKVKALELLGKHTALFTENLNLMNNGGKFDAPQQVTNVYINHRKKDEKLSD